MKNSILKSRKAIVQIPLIAAVVGAVAVIGLIAQGIATEVSLQPPKTPRIDRLLASLEEAVNAPVQPEIQPTQPTVEQPAPALSEPTKEIEKKPEIIEEEKPEEEFVDPREIKDVQRQLKDMTREIKRLRTLLKKIPNSETYSSKLNEVAEKINTFTNTLKGNQVLRENLQEFYDEQLWDTVNEVRNAAEIPKEIANIEKELKKLDKSLKSSVYKKTGLDLEKVKEYVEQIKTALNEAKGNYAEGNLEDAALALEPIREGMHPGEISCVLNSFRDIMREMPRIKDAEIKEQLAEVLAPITEAVVEGDFREACRTTNEMRDEFMKIMRYSMKKGLPTQMREKLDKLQGLMEQKFGGEQESVETPTKEVPVEKLEK